MELFCIQSQDGKFYKATGVNGRGRRWNDSLSSAKFYNKNGGAAIDIHSSGRFTVMRFQNGKNEIFGTNDIDEAIKELLKIK